VEILLKVLKVRGKCGERMESRMRSKSVRSEPVKLSGHTRSVRGVSFSPKQHQLFCSGGYDGLVNFYDAEKQLLTHSTSVIRNLFFQPICPFPLHTTRDSKEGEFDLI